MTLWILECQKFTNTGFVHIGYLNKIFKTKKAAADYYDEHIGGPEGMRELNSFGKWSSDWDPITRIRYVVRIYDQEELNISEQDRIETE